MFDEAFEQLGLRIGTVTPSGTRWRTSCAPRLAYRASALDDPHLFALMFSGPTLLSRPAARRTVAGTALGPLRAAACAVEEKALRPTPTRARSLTLWTTVHGWVALQLRGFLPPSADDGARTPCARCSRLSLTAPPQTAPNRRSPASPRPGTM